MSVANTAVVLVATTVLAACGNGVDTRSDASVMVDARRDLGRQDLGPPDDSGADDATAESGARDASPDSGCEPGLVPCPEADGVVRCVDLQSEDCHCGMCGRACDCDNGRCADCNNLGSTLCLSPPPAGDWQCVSTTSEIYCAQTLLDRNNCGFCQHACETGEDCVGGACVAAGDGG